MSSSYNPVFGPWIRAARVLIAGSTQAKETGNPTAASPQVAPSDNTWITLKKTATNHPMKPVSVG